MRIELRIESLVLHGVSAIDRHTVAASLQQELTRLVEEQSAPVSGPSRTTARLDGGELEPHGGDPQQLGIVTARAVYDVIARFTTGAAS